jgi:AAHS family 4-hydroxybenzoate transporter-like MFS transporter
MLVFGITTGLVPLSGSIEQLTLLRFVGGLGIGGVVPNAIALMAEFAPKKRRALMITIMFSGVSIGAALPGLVDLLTPPEFGWKESFVLGGVVPVLLAVLCVFALPESLKFLVLKGRLKKGQNVLRRVDKHAAWSEVSRASQQETASTSTSQQKKATLSNLRELFASGQRGTTLALWGAFFAFFLAFFFLSTWTPILLNTLGVAPQYATAAQTTFQAGGVIGGIALASFIDRRGPKPIVVLFLIAVPLVASVGYISAISVGWLIAIEFAAGACVLGLSFGLTALSGTVFPTRMRSTGSGLALGVGSIGSICGAVVGGTMLAAGIDVRHMFVLVAATLLLGALATWSLLRSLRRTKRESLLASPMSDSVDHAAL